MWLFVTLLSCVLLKTNAGNFDGTAEGTCNASTDPCEFKITGTVNQEVKIVATGANVKAIGIVVQQAVCGATALTSANSILLPMGTEFGLAAITAIYVSRNAGLTANTDFICLQCYGTDPSTSLSCSFTANAENAGAATINTFTIPSVGWWVTKGAGGTTTGHEQVKIAGNLGYICASKTNEGAGYTLRKPDNTGILASRTLVAGSGSTLPYSSPHGLFITNDPTVEISFLEVPDGTYAACRPTATVMPKMEAAHTTGNVWVTSMDSAPGAAVFNIDETVDAPVTLKMITQTIDAVEIAGNDNASTDLDTAGKITGLKQVTIPEIGNEVLSNLHFFNKILTASGLTYGGVGCYANGVAAPCQFSLEFGTAWPSTAANTWNINASTGGDTNSQAIYNSLEFTTSTTADVYGWLKFVGAGAYRLHFGEGTDSTSTYGQLLTRAAQTANTQQNIFVGNYGTTAATIIKARFELGTNGGPKTAVNTDSWFGYSWKNDIPKTTASALANTIETFDIILKQGMESTFKITTAKITATDAIKFDVDGAHQGETILKMGSASTPCTTNDIYFVNTGFEKVCGAVLTDAVHVLTLEKTSASVGSQYFVVSRVAQGNIGANSANAAVDMTNTLVSGAITNGGNGYINTGTDGYGSLKFTGAASAFEKDIQLFVVTAGEQLFLNFGSAADATAPTAKQGTTDNDGDTVAIDLTESKHIRLGRSTITVAAGTDDYMDVTCFDGAGAAVTCSILAFHNIVTNAERDTDAAASGSNTADVILPMAGEWFISKLAGTRDFKRTASGSANFLGFSTKKSAATTWTLKDAAAATLITDSIAAASAASPYATAGTPKTEETPFIKVASAIDANALSIAAAANQYVGVLSGTFDGLIPSTASTKIYFYADEANTKKYVSLQTGAAVPALLELEFVGTKPHGFGYLDGQAAAQGDDLKTTWSSLFDNTNDMNKVYIWQSAMTASKHLHTNCYSAVSATPTASACQYSIRSIATAPTNKAYVDGEWFIYKKATVGEWGPTLVTAANKKSHFKHGGNFAGTYNLIFTDSAGTATTTDILDTIAAQRLNAAATAGEVRHVTIQHNVLGTDAAGKTFHAGFDTTGLTTNQFYAYSWDNDVTAVDLGAGTILDVIAAKDRRVYSPVVKSSGFATTAEYYIKINELDGASDDIRIYGASTFLGLDATNKYLKFEQNKDHVKIAANTVTTAAAAGETFNILLESPTTKLFRIEKTTTTSTNLATSVTGTTPPTSAPTAASGPTAAPTAASGPTAAPTAASDSSMYTYSHGFIFILSIITLIGNFIIY